MKIEVKATKKKTTQSVMKKKKQPRKKNGIVRRIVFSIFLIFFLIGAIILVLLSDLFNIKQIKILNNSKLSEEQIIKDSTLEIGNNMFKTLTSDIKKGIKSNPYIDNVKIKKKLNGDVVIDVKERTTTFMLKGENSYTYINNQGYILENSEEVLEVPIIIGFETQDLTPGNRIDKQDLKKLDQVIQIMESAKSQGINQKIYSIDISDASNYILEIPTEAKTVQFGDSTNINVKMLWIIDLMEREKGVAGDIVLNVSNIKKVFFREKV